MQKYIGPDKTFADLQAAADAVTDYLRDHGYFVAQAFLPEQKIQDGVIFLYEPLSTLASEIVGQVDGVSAPALRSSIYGFALILLFSGFMLSIASQVIRLPLRKYELSN